MLLKLIERFNPYKKKPEPPKPFMGLLNDKQITDLCYTTNGKRMITPFIPTQVKRSAACLPNGQPLYGTVSHGLSSFGYDIRLSNEEFYTFKHIPGKVVDPKDFDNAFLEKQPCLISGDDSGEYYIIPGNSYALGVTVEQFNMPPDVMAICLTKSTYARCGLICNITPLEPGWSGSLTLEIANCSNSDVRVYVNEGIAQLLFYRGEQPSVTYDQRDGKYNKQPNQVVTAKV